MKAAVRILAGVIAIAWLVGCATQEEASRDTTPETGASTEQAGSQPADEAAPASLTGTRIAYFETADGTVFESESIVTLPTGGPPSGRLLPASSNPDVVLYLTRDGSVPSAENNWGGPIEPDAPRPISRPLEGVASYRVVAELDGVSSEPFTLTVQWQHEESPELDRPVFTVDGREVAGSVEIPISAGDDPAKRLQISCGYDAAMLYISRDGTEPSVDDNWRSQQCAGTYLWSPEPTAAEYRVIAIWQGAQSPVASLSVEWVE